MSLQIRKKSTSSWEHIKDGKNIILSNGSFRFQNNQFELTEISGVDQFDQPRTPLADITLYDDTASGSPETFTSTTVFIDRLRELGYPFFSSALGGSSAVSQIVAGTNITIDPSDGLGIVTINSTGGGGGDASFDQEVNQTAHGLSVGDVVRMDGANYIKALADNATNAVGIGIVTVVTDADNFTYQYGGLTSINLGLSNGDEALLQDDGSIGTTEGTINLYLGTQTPEGFLIEIGQGFETESSTVAKTLSFAASDEDTDLAVATGVLTFRMPYAMTLTEVRANVKTAPTGSTLQVDINEGGVSILSTVISIDAGEKTSTTATTPPVISDANLADDAEITIDIDQIGSTIAGTGLKITLIGT